MTDTAHPNCAAHSCPCLGSMSRSTTGSTEWYCAIHFGADGKRWGDVTAELQRLAWLVTLTRDLRTYGGAKDWTDARDAAADKVIRLNQSSHLVRGDHESLGAWLARLESVLHTACAIPAQAELA